MLNVSCDQVKPENVPSLATIFNKNGIGHDPSPRHVCVWEYSFKFASYLLFKCNDYVLFLCYFLGIPININPVFL